MIIADLWSNVRLFLRKKLDAKWMPWYNFMVLQTGGHFYGCPVQQTLEITGGFEDEQG